MSRQISRTVQLDHVAERQQQWAQEMPDVDTTGMAILGRARWITLRVRPAIEAVFARHGLDAGEFDVLTTLRRSGEPFRLRPTDLYQSLMISSGGLTDRLARLQRAGFIARRPSPDDARSLLVELTPAGRAVTELAFREDMDVEAALLTGLTRAECDQLASLLAKLALSLPPES